jgi:glucose/arabinose dehydrogenase
MSGVLRRSVVLALAVFLQVWAGLATAATWPSGFAEETVATGFPGATAMAFAPDGRLFVARQNGQLRVVQNDQILPAAFVSLSVISNGERGLLGIAFDPDFLANGYVYLYYTTDTPVLHNRVSRFTANGSVAVPGSEVLILDLEPLSASNHNGGALHFGPDGYLYVAVGENAVPSNSQTLSNRLGKILRVSPTGAIPTDNPFYDVAAGVNRAIWALGLRNPYTFAFQASTERMFVNDVGAGSWEEVNEGLAGANYGWPATEGPTTNPAYESPILAYSHAVEPSVCAITGGSFYDESVGRYPASFDGDYFFADFCAGWVRRFDPDADTVTGFGTGAAQPVDLDVGPDGNLYVLERGAGAVKRVTHCSGAAPTLPAIEPISGTSGSMVLASGSGFQSDARLEFGVMPAATVPLDDDLLGAVPTLPSGTVSVRIVGPTGCRSNAIAYSVTPPPSSCGLLGIEPVLLMASIAAVRRGRPKASSRSRC